MRFRSYLIGVSSLVTLYALLLLSVFMLQLGVPTSNSWWTYAFTEKKMRSAAAISGRKILVVAGSNALFGVKAGLIEKETNIKTVNMGVNAGLGIRYILDKAEEVAKSGDIIILPLEYEDYLDQGTPQYISADYIFSRDPHYFFRNLSLKDEFAYAMALKPREILTRVLKRFKPDVKGPSRWDFMTVDDYGDVTVHKKSLYGLLKKEIDNYPPPDRSAASLHSVGTRAIKDFISWCREHKVTLYATFPSFVYYSRYTEPAQKKFYDGVVEFYKKLGVPVLGTPYDFMYDKKNFFDTNYHLIPAAAKKRTEQIISLLKAEDPRLAGDHPNGYALN